MRTGNHRGKLEQKTAGQLDLFVIAANDDGAKPALAIATKIVQSATTHGKPRVPSSPVERAKAQNRHDNTAASTSRGENGPGHPASPRREVRTEAVHLLDVRAAAAWLGLSKSTLDKMRCRGTGPRFIRATARAVRYDPKDLAEFVRARSQASTSETLPTS